MSEPEVIKCADRLYRHVMYGPGPYITDYPEQVVISGIVQGWCPRYVPTTTLLKLLTQALLRHLRCTAYKNDLKTPGIPRSKEHTDEIKEALRLGDLWDVYGVISKVEVRYWH